METESKILINTLDKALCLAQSLSRELRLKNGKTYRNFQIFSALAPDEREALAAFFIWKSRGETIKELRHR
jgi:hypothetical protein